MTDRDKDAASRETAHRLLQPDTEPRMLADIRADERLLPKPSHARRPFGLAVSIASLSLAAHVLGITLVLLSREPRAVAEEQETPVEIVQAPPAEPKPAEPAPAPQEAEKKLADTKQPPPQPPPAAKPEPPKPVEQVKPVEQPKPVEQVKPVEQAKQAEQPKPVANPKPSEKLRSEPQPPQESLQSLKDELAALQQHMNELKEEAVAAAIPNDAYDSLPDSFKAVALPSQSASGDVPIGYEQEIFSELAKAKKAGRYLETPGTASVVFSIDERGKLLDVKLTVSSGINALDQEAIATVRRASPFPPPPKGAKRTFLAAVSFIAEH